MSATSLQIKSKAEKLYKEYLRYVEKMIGNNTTYGSDLAKICDLFFAKHFIGVYASDQKAKMPDNSSCIYNLDKLSEPGSHWIACVKDKGRTLVYDSFGRDYKKIIPSFKGYYENVKNTERDVEQEIKEKNCGARCIAFLFVYYDKGYKYAKYI